MTPSLPLLGGVAPLCESHDDVLNSSSAEVFSSWGGASGRVFLALDESVKRYPLSPPPQASHQPVSDGATTNPPSEKPKDKEGVSGVKLA